MQLAIFIPAQPGHLRDLFVHFQALGFKLVSGVRGQFQGQFPREQALLFRFGLEGFMQAFSTVLREGFALGLRGQRVEGVELRGDVRVLVQKTVQGALVIITGLRHVRVPVQVRQRRALSVAG